MKKKRLFGQDGFTLVEVVIASLVLGVLAMAIVNQSKLVSNSQRDANERTITNLIVDKLAVELSRQQTCTANFGTLVLPQPDIVNAINDSAGNEIIKKGKQYGASSSSTSGVLNVNTLRVDKISLTADPNTVGQMILKIDFSRKSSYDPNNLGSLNPFKTAPSVSLPLKFQGSTGNSMKIIYCSNDIASSIASAIRLSCQGNSSIYTPPDDANPYGLCTSANLVSNCSTPGQYIKKIETVNGVMKATCGTLETAVANVCPPGKVADKLNSDGTLNCIDPFPTTTCPAGQMMVKGGAGGALTCINTDVGCPPQYAIKSFGGGGTVVCANYYPLQTCPTFVQSVSPAGVTCAPGAVKAITCPAGQFIQKFLADGTPVCAPWINLGTTCPGGQAATGIDASGNLVCQTMVRRLSCNGSYSPTGKLFTQCPGTVMNRDGGTNSFCRIAGSSCPGGFTPCLSWGNSSATVSCTDTNSACSYSVQTRYATGTNVFQNPVSSSQQTAQCYYWARNSGPWVRSCTLYGGPTATTPVSEVGCY